MTADADLRQDFFFLFLTTCFLLIIKCAKMSLEHAITWLPCCLVDFTKCFLCTYFICYYIVQYFNLLIPRMLMMKNYLGPWRRHFVCLKWVSLRTKFLGQSKSLVSLSYHLLHYTWKVKNVNCWNLFWT